MANHQNSPAKTPSLDKQPPQDPSIQPPPYKRKYYDASILIFINLMNYCDRITLAGILEDLQRFFGIKDDNSGLIQTIFMVSYMLAGLIFGTLGDRFTRKYLIAIGVGIWSASNITASFVNEFWAFLVLRSFLGVGHACFTSICPSFISDLFVGDLRFRIMSIFFLAVPLGSGVGYVVGTQATKILGSWRWSLRVTVPIGVVNVFLSLLVLREPQRGHVEGTVMAPTSVEEDLKYLAKNRSYVILIVAFTGAIFATGALGWWIPTLLARGLKMKYPDIDHHNVGSVFGLIAFLSGSLGLLAAYFTSQKLKKKCPRVDSLICSVGLFTSTFFLSITMFVVTVDRFFTYTVLFLGLFCLNVIWALTMNICMGVVVPSRRGTAVGMQMFVVHLFGDAGSPYIMGLVSDALYSYYQNKEEDENNRFYALRYAYFVPLCGAFLGGILYVVLSVFIVEDLERAKTDATRSQ